MTFGSIRLRSFAPSLPLGRWWSAIGAALLFSVSAYAVDVQTLTPFADNNPTVSVLGATALESRECWIGSYLSYARQPLRGQSAASLGGTMQSLSALSLAPSCGVTANISLLANVPVQWTEFSRDTNASEPGKGSIKSAKARIGDSSLVARWTILPRAIPFAGRSVALAPTIKFGSKQAGLVVNDQITAGTDGGDHKISGGLKFIYDQYLLPQHYLAANAEYFYRQRQLVVDESLGSELRWGLAYAYLLEPVSGLSAFAELHGRRQAVIKPSSGLGTTGEWQVGLSAKPIGDHLGVFVAAGSGIGSGYGAPSARVVLGVELMVSKVQPPAKPFVESEIPATPVAIDSSGAVHMNLRDSKRKDVAFSLRGGATATLRSGTVLGGGPYFQAMSPGIYTIDVNAVGYNKRSQQLVVSPGVTSLVEVIPRRRGEMAIVVRLEVPAIEFESKKAVIKSSSYPALNNLVEILRSTAAIQLLAIEGHTDNVGGRDRNVKLSLDRANAVENYLIDKGIDPRRLTTKGFGPDDPIDSNANEHGRARNRRVEFIIRAVTTAR